MDIAFIEGLVQSIINAAPAIIKGVQTAEPFVADIVALAENGGKPTADQWTTLRARLDAGSAALAAAAAEPDPNA